VSDRPRGGLLQRLWLGLGTREPRPRTRSAGIENNKLVSIFPGTPQTGADCSREPRRFLPVQ
jgi:hypothetical protein